MLKGGKWGFVGGIVLLICCGCRTTSLPYEVGTGEGERGVLAIVVGGLGHNQTGGIARTIARECRGVRVISAGTYNGFLGDIDGIVKKYPHSRLVLIGHSLGAQTICRSDRADYLVLIDPVGKIKVSAGEYDIFIRQKWLGPIVSDVRSLRTITVSAGHVDIAYRDVVIRRIVKVIKSLTPPERPAG